MLAGSDISVVEGNNGWLFLSAFKGNEYLSKAADLGRWKQTLLPLHIANYKARAARLLARGIPFAVFFAPEASGIYSEFLPSGYTVERPTACELLAEALNRAGVNAVCPSEVLRRAKGAVDLYQKVDSHWSPYGAYLAYAELLEALGPVYHSRKVPWQSILFNSSKGFGDLGVHLTPERNGYLQSVDIPALPVEADKNIFDVREKNVRHFRFAGGQGRALIFRDSFTNALSPFFERTFQETILVAPAPTMLDDAIDHFKPDLVVLEVAERALYAPEDPLADWTPRSFAQDYLEQATNPKGGRLEAQAVNALISGQVEHALALSATATVLEGDEARLYNLAWALSHGGWHDLCLKVVKEALASRPDAFLHYLEANAHAALGCIAEAVSALRCALQMKPNNAWFLSNLGNWLLQLGQLEEALYVLEKACCYAPLYQPSWELMEKIATQMADNAKLELIRQERPKINLGLTGRRYNAAPCIASGADWGRIGIPQCVRCAPELCYFERLHGPWALISPQVFLVQIICPREIGNLLQDWLAVCYFAVPEDLCARLNGIRAARE